MNQQNFYTPANDPFDLSNAPAHAPAPAQAPSVVVADEGRELAWDDYIEQESAEFVLFPKGEYPFVVKGIERARHPGSAKLPPCPKAVVHLEFTDTEGNKTTLKENLFLHTKTEGILSSFFASIGQKPKGERIQLNWRTVPGATGRARLDVRTWTADDGRQMQSNQVKRYISVNEKPEPASEDPFKGAFG